MKYILIFISLFLPQITFTQSVFPDFLQGTWKMENKEIFEHWDSLNDNALVKKLEADDYGMKSNKNKSKLIWQN